MFPKVSLQTFAYFSLARLGKMATPSLQGELGKQCRQKGRRLGAMH